MRMLDFSSWQGLLSTVLALSLITLVGVGIRLAVMQTIQQRRQRENRQINERLRTLIAAYKSLGGSFTGELAVDPTHMRDLRRRAADPAANPSTAAPGEAAADAASTTGNAGATDGQGVAAGDSGDGHVHGVGDASGRDDAGAIALRDAIAGSSDRSRRIRDAVEAALSDILLLGTDEQVRLAARAAEDLVAGRRVHTAELVASLRDFIRKVLDLDPVPPDLAIPRQGPSRPAGSGGKGGGRDGAAGRGGAGGGGGGGGGGSGGGAGMGMGMGMGQRGGDAG